MKKEIENTQIDEAMAQFCPFGYRDIGTALQTIWDASGKEYLDIGELYQICNDFVESTDLSMDKIDPVYCVYDYYYQIARTDIEQATGKDICNDDPYSHIDISGNYMCTSIDGKDEDIKALKDLINTIPADDQTPAIKWLFNTI